MLCVNDCKRVKIIFLEEPGMELGKGVWLLAIDFITEDAAALVSFIFSEIF